MNTVLYIYSKVVPALKQRASKNININEVKWERFPKKETAITLGLYKVYCLVFLLSESCHHATLTFGQHFTVCTALSHISTYLTLLTFLRNGWGRHYPRFTDKGALSPFPRQRSWDSQQWRHLPVVTHWVCPAQHIFHCLRRSRNGKAKTSSLPLELLLLPLYLVAAFFLCFSTV